MQLEQFIKKKDFFVFLMHLTYIRQCMYFKQPSKCGSLKWLAYFSSQNKIKEDNFLYPKYLV